MPGSIPVAPTKKQPLASVAENHGQHLASKEMARQVAIAQGIVDPVSGRVLGRFVHTGPDA